MPPHRQETIVADAVWHRSTALLKVRRRQIRGLPLTTWDISAHFDATPQPGSYSAVTVGGWHPDQLALRR